MARDMTLKVTPNMTPAEVAAWESMMKDGTFWDFTANNAYPKAHSKYLAELRRRAREVERVL